MAKICIRNFIQKIEEGGQFYCLFFISSILASFNFFIKGRGSLFIFYLVQLTKVLKHTILHMITLLKCIKINSVFYAF